MGFGRFVHLIGSVLLLAATALLIVADISAPVINGLAILKVDLGDNNSAGRVNFGTFGYCVRGTSGGWVIPNAYSGSSVTDFDITVTAARAPTSGTARPT